MTTIFKFWAGLVLCFTLVSCGQKEVKTIEQNTTEMSRSADRIARSMEHFEEMMIMFIKLQQERYRTVTPVPTGERPFGEEDFDEDFGF